MEQQVVGASLPDRKPVNFSQIRRPRPVRTNLNEGLCATDAQPSPPLETPLSPSESDHESGFHNYLRAFCQFDPPTNVDVGEDALLVTAPIRPGDLILVHSVHANGWADGTVLTSGARGWLPTNYCEPFDHPYLRSLLNAMTQFWDLLVGDEDANLSSFVRQDYIRGLIAGVRYLLERANCLHRDAALVQRSASIKRMRKGLLAELHSLVRIGTSVQETMTELFADEVVHALLDDMVAKAFKVVTRAVGFVDILSQERLAATRLIISDRTTKDAGAPKSSQADVPSNSLDAASDEGTVPTDATKDLLTIATASHDYNKSAQRSRPCVKNGNMFDAKAAVARPKSQLITHPVSLVNRQNAQSSARASDQLALARDDCTSRIGAFVGRYLHSRSSEELVATTERLAKACENLLAVIDQISAEFQDVRTSVQPARANFQLKLDELLKATRDVFRFSDAPYDDVVMLPEQTSHLVSVGTSLIQAVIDCVNKTGKVIEQTDDVDLAQRALDKEGLHEEQAVPGSQPDQSPPVSPRSSHVQQDLVLTKLPTTRPSLRPRAMTTTNVIDSAQRSSATNSDSASLVPTFPQPSHSSLPAPAKRSSAEPAGVAGQVHTPLTSPRPSRARSTSPGRNCSVQASISGSMDTRQSSFRDSGNTAVSDVSTRATTPEHTKETNSPHLVQADSFASLASLQSAAVTDASIDAEAMLLQKTYANELTFNDKGRVASGSMHALVERLSTGDDAPDREFVVAFFLTFRYFTTPRELAQALIHRFDYIGDSTVMGEPVKLRIYNVFKGWLETYWSPESDKDALGDIRYFALHKLIPQKPEVGRRLLDLIRKVTTLYQNGVFTGPLVSGVGKSSIAQHENNVDAPEPIISKSRLNVLRNAVIGGTSYNVLDIDAREVARQLTILASDIFCQIQPDEMLSLDWGTPDTTRAPNVRLSARVNTNLTYLVSDTVLASEKDAKKRAQIIKQWSKVAMHCFELQNYDSLIAIMESFNSKALKRLHRTWASVSKNTVTRLAELNAVVDVSQTLAYWRHRPGAAITPCLPWLGMYLKLLVRTAEGNTKLKELPGTGIGPDEAMFVINFGRYRIMYEITVEAQRFQMPYKLKEVPEIQTWLRMHLDRMHTKPTNMLEDFRRSCILEPKRDIMSAITVPEARQATAPLSEMEQSYEDRPKTAASVKTTQSFKSHGQDLHLLLAANFNFKGRPALPAKQDPAEQT